MGGTPVQQLSHLEDYWEVSASRKASLNQAPSWTAAGTFYIKAGEEANRESSTADREKGYTLENTFFGNRISTQSIRMRQKRICKKLNIYPQSPP